MIDFLYLDEPEVDEASWQKAIVKGKAVTEMLDAAVARLSVLDDDGWEVRPHPGRPRGGGRRCRPRQRRGQAAAVQGPGSGARRRQRSDRRAAPVRVARRARAGADARQAGGHQEPSWRDRPRGEDGSTDAGTGVGGPRPLPAARRATTGPVPAVPASSAETGAGGGRPTARPWWRRPGFYVRVGLAAAVGAGGLPRHHLRPGVAGQPVRRPGSGRGDRRARRRAVQRTAVAGAAAAARPRPRRSIGPASRRGSW